MRNREPAETSKSTRRKQTGRYRPNAPVVVASLLITCGISSCFVLTQAQGQDRAQMTQHVNRGNMLMSRRQFEAAIQEYEAAAKIDPQEAVVKRNIVECYNNWGTFLFGQQKFEDAIAQFERCLELDPRHGYARHNLKLVHQRMQQEGIPIPPPGTRGGTEKPPEKVVKEKPKEPEPAARITTSTSSVQESSAPQTPSTLFGSLGASTGGKPLYMTGSPLYPTYKSTPSAGSVQVGGFSSSRPDLPGAGRPPQRQPAAIPADPSTVPPEPSGIGGTAPAVKTETAPAVSSSSDLASGKSAESSEPAESSSTSFSTGPEKGSSSNKPVQAKALGNESGAEPVKSPEPASSGNREPEEAGSIEEKILELEKNVSGHTYPKLPYLKRLEQMEVRLFKQPRSGTLNERVDYLRKKVGL